MLVGVLFPTQSRKEFDSLQIFREGYAYGPASYDLKFQFRYASANEER